MVTTGLHQYTKEKTMSDRSLRTFLDDDGM
ncbi:MAG: hypothetical protein QOJ30_4300, partial [Pseudonocardiales bacterium]|nr:hypothetical protein [Pseudonocardiales bacterium]